MANLKMPQINLAVISGYLVKEPTLRHTTKKVPVSNFIVAHPKKFKDNSGEWKEETCFIGVVAWHKLAESCYEFLQKGNAVLITGNLQSRTLEFDDGSFRNIIEIKASKIQFLNKVTSFSEANSSYYNNSESDTELIYKNKN